MSINIEEVKKPENLTKEQLLSMATEHIEHYEMLAGCGNPNVRISECNALVRIWKGVLLAAQDGLLYQDMKKWPNMQHEVWCAWAEQQQQ